LEGRFGSNESIVSVKSRGIEVFDQVSAARGFGNSVRKGKKMRGLYEVVKKEKALLMIFSLLRPI